MISYLASGGALWKFICRSHFTDGAVFFKEYGIIVLGVLTALVGEQLVEAVRHDREVAISERALKADYSGFIRHHAERDASKPCVAKRLSELRAIVDDGAKQGMLGAVGPIPQPPPHSWEITTWDSMVASGATAHIPQAQVIRYSQIAHWAKDAQVTGTEESEVWSVLDGLAGAPRRFSDAEQAKLREDISRAAHFSVLLGDITDTTEQTIAETGRLTPAEIAAARVSGTHSRYVEQMCTAIPYTPAAG